MLEETCTATPVISPASWRDGEIKENTSKHNSISLLFYLDTSIKHKTCQNYCFSTTLWAFVQKQKLASFSKRSRWIYFMSVLVSNKSISSSRTSDKLSLSLSLSLSHSHSLSPDIFPTKISCASI